MLIVIDNDDADVDMHNLEMITDTSGLGTSITIPSLIIPKKEGTELVDHIKGGNLLVLFLQFHWVKLILLILTKL